MRENWNLWRLVLSDSGFDFHTVFHEMTPEQIEQANLALDLVQKARRNQQ